MSGKQKKTKVHSTESKEPPDSKQKGQSHIETSLHTVGGAVYKIELPSDVPIRRLIFVLGRTLVFYEKFRKANFHKTITAYTLHIRGVAMVMNRLRNRSHRLILDMLQGVFVSILLGFFVMFAFISANTVTVILD